MIEKTWLKPADEPLHPAALKCLEHFIRTRIQKQEADREALLGRMAIELRLSAQSQRLSKPEERW